VAVLAQVVSLVKEVGKDVCSCRILKGLKISVLHIIQSSAEDSQSSLGMARTWTAFNL